MVPGFFLGGGLFLVWGGRFVFFFLDIHMPRYNHLFPQHKRSGSEVFHDSMCDKHHFYMIPGADSR